MELFRTKECMQKVSIGFELLDMMNGFPMSDGEIVVLGNDRFTDAGGRFRVIIEWSRLGRTIGCGSGGLLKWHCLLLMLIDRI